MASSSMCKTYAALKGRGDWMSRLEIAHESGVGPRWVGVCSRLLVEGGVAESKTIDRRKYYRLSTGHEDSAVVNDINESNRIKSI